MLITVEYKGLKDSINVTVKKDTFARLNLVYHDLVLSYEGLGSDIPEIGVLVETAYGRKFDITYNNKLSWTLEHVEDVTIDWGAGPRRASRYNLVAEFYGVTAIVKVEYRDRKIKEIKLTDTELVMSYDGDIIETAFIGLKAEFDDGEVINIDDDLVTWTSDDPSVAEVIGDGFEIRAVGPGETLIHAVYEDFHGTVKVIVEDKTSDN